MTRRSWLLVLLWLGAAQAADAQIAWKWRSGEAITLETSTTSRLTLRLAGQALPQDSDSTTRETFRLVRKAGEQWQVERTVDALQMRTQGFGGEVLDRVAPRLRGSTFTATVEPAQRKVGKLEGVAEWLKAVQAEEPSLRDALADLIDAETLRAEMENLLVGFLPGKAVRPGERWKRPGTVALGPLKSFSGEAEYVAKGKAAVDGQQLEQIDVTWTLSYQAPPKGSGGLLLNVVEGKLKPSQARETYWFDAQAGRLVRVERSFRVRGPLTVAVGNERVVVDVEQELTSKTRLVP
jgi:hypothetical protein